MSRPLRIAFLACNKRPDRFAEDASYVYRCDNLAHALRALGHEVLTCHHRQLPWRTPPLDVAVVHRPRLSWALVARLAWLRRQGTRLLADFDDLIFDPSLAAVSPGVINAKVSERFMRGQFRRSAAALAGFSGFTVATEPLAQALRAQLGAAGRPVWVLSNAVHHRWPALAAARPAWAPPPPVIRYLPGTPSHDRDFAGISAALAEVLRRVPHARLELVGPLREDGALPSEQVTRRPRLPFQDYHQALPGARVNLAPLERTRFTECKSAIKVIEAGFWGVPTVATGVADVQRFVGAGAILAEQPADWVAALVRLLTDDAWHAQACVELPQRVMALADVHQQAQRWLAAWAPPAGRG